MNLNHELRRFNGLVFGNVIANSFSVQQRVVKCWLCMTEEEKATATAALLATFAKYPESKDITDEKSFMKHFKATLKDPGAKRCMQLWVTREKELLAQRRAGDTTAINYIPFER